MMNNSNLGCSSVDNSATAFNLEDDDQEEESGWTAYFDDYFSDKTPSKHIYDDGGGSGSMLCNLQSRPSMVSDAASCAAWKNNNDGRSSTRAACSSFDGRQKLRFKTSNRHKKFSDCYDDSLEDTASSPVNTPKGRGDYGDEEEQCELKQEVKKEGERRLRKKGLCLVPVSMLINYYIG